MTTPTNNMKRAVAAFVLMFSIFSGCMHAARAAVELSVTQKYNGKINYAMPGDTAAGGLDTLVREGLDRSGFLACPLEQSAVNGMGRAPDYALWAKFKVEILIIADTQETGSQISTEITVYHISQKSRILTRRYTNSNSGEGKGTMAAFICDDIIKTLTGESGIESSRIIYSAQTDKGRKEIFVTYPNGSGCQQVTFDNCISISPSWRDAGTRFFYTSYLNKFPNIYAADLKTGKRTRFVYFPGLNAQPSVSPDGKTVAVVLSRDGNPEIYTLGTDGSGLTRITNTKAVESSPTWSPDSKQLAYTSDRAGSPQIYVQPARPGTEARRVSFGSSYFSSPDWSPKENLIACSASAGGTYQIFIINPDTKDCRQLTSEPYNFEDPSFAPSGKHIVLTRSRKYRSELGTMALRDGTFRPVKVKGNDPATPDWASGQ